MQFLYKSYFQSVNRFFYIGLAVIISVMIVIYIFSTVYDINIKMFLADPASFTNSPIYLGIISNAGIILWAFSAAILLFTAILIWSNNSLINEMKFLLTAFILTLLLMIDDLLLFHELLFPKYLGIPQKFFFIFYFVYLIFYLFYFKTIHLQAKLVYLLIALLFFASSIFFDTMVKETHLTNLLEDGSKLCGNFCWFFYHSEFAKDLISRNYIQQPKINL